jgi:hypothetical protein
MNRIHQGKVTTVEIRNGEDDHDIPKWGKIANGASTMWQLARWCSRRLKRISKADSGLNNHGKRFEFWKCGCPAQFV